LGALWLLVVAERAILTALAVAGLLGAVLCAMRARQGFARAQDPDAHSLRLSIDTLEIREADRTERVAWTELASIEIDEEHLCLVLRRFQGDALSLQPRFGGLGLEALSEILDQRVKRARP
jgi:hypothetical protein